MGEKKISEILAEMDLIQKAAVFAIRHHEGVKRRDGTPYFHHPARVAKHVAFLGGSNADMVSAALLHDVVEDPDANGNRIPLEKIKEEFGTSVASLVGELTNCSKGIPGLNRAGRKRFDHARLARASNEAKRIKMCDRIDNLNDLPEGGDFSLLYAKESRDLAKAVGDADPDLHAELLEAIERTERSVVQIMGVQTTGVQTTGLQGKAT